MRGASPGGARAAAGVLPPVSASARASAGVQAAACRGRIRRTRAQPRGARGCRTPLRSERRCSPGMRRPRGGARRPCVGAWRGCARRRRSSASSRTGRRAPFRGSRLPRSPLHAAARAARRAPGTSGSGSSRRAPPRTERSAPRGSLPGVRIWLRGTRRSTSRAPRAGAYVVPTRRRAGCSTDYPGSPTPKAFGSTSNRFGSPRGGRVVGELAAGSAPRGGTGRPTDEVRWREASPSPAPGGPPGGRLRRTGRQGRSFDEVLPQAGRRNSSPTPTSGPARAG